MLDLISQLILAGLAYLFWRKWLKASWDLEEEQERSERYRQDAKLWKELAVSNSVICQVEAEANQSGLDLSDQRESNVSID